MSITKNIFSAALVVLLASGCSHSQKRIAQDAAVGGVLAGGLGAASGALIGNAIANGDVAASALLGTAIGAPVGILLGAYYAGADEELEALQNDQIILANERYLAQTRYELQAMREKLQDDMSSMELDPKRREYRFYGQSLGNPYR